MSLRDSLFAASVLFMFVSVFEAFFRERYDRASFMMSFSIWFWLVATIVEV